MNKVAFVWFTFDGDADCLLTSVESVRRMHGAEVPICLYDDAAHPLSQEVVRLVRPTVYEQTDFNRQGNLNGKACILGMLNCLQGAGRVTQSTWISKIDSDTLLLRDWCMWDYDVRFQGSMWHCHTLGAGLNYTMRADVPEDILQMLARSPSILTGRLPEDATISLLAHVVSPFGAVSHICAPGHPDRLVGGWKYVPGKESRREDGARFAVLTFGNRHDMVDTPVEHRRQRVAKVMREFYDWFCREQDASRGSA